MKTLLLILVIMFSWSVEASNKSEVTNEVEPRGKGKYALIIHFFYVVATKLIVLKMVYGALFYVLIYKGWHFLLWFIHYLKKHKHHHEYIEDHHFEHYDHGHFDHHDHGHFDHHDHGHFDHSYGNFDDHSYGTFDHQPYGYDKYGYGTDKKRIYDADGSYAVKGRSG